MIPSHGVYDNFSSGNKWVEFEKALQTVYTWKKNKTFPSRVNCPLFISANGFDAKNGRFCHEKTRRLIFVDRLLDLRKG